MFTREGEQGGDSSCLGTLPDAVVKQYQRALFIVPFFMEAKNPSEALAKDNGKNSSKGQAQFGLNIFTRSPFILIV
jgi:hypothetical protein